MALWWFRLYNPNLGDNHAVEYKNCFGHILNDKANYTV